eukprot:COSAG06_NODE_8183_length_2246_cov_1.569632_2_plen_151_part_00
MPSPSSALSVSALENKRVLRAALQGRTDTMALLGGNAAAGELQTMYDGPRPPPAHHGVKPGKGYQPMKKQVGPASELLSPQRLLATAAPSCSSSRSFPLLLSVAAVCCQGAIILGIGGKSFLDSFEFCFEFGTLSNQAKDSQINLTHSHV